MAGNKRPLSVLLIGWVYIAVGAVGFVAHANGIRASGGLRFDDVAVELTELTAAVSGAFILQGRNWARWLALAWIAFHVLLSASQFRAFAVHCVFLVLIAWAVFQPAASMYFRRGNRAA